MDTCVRCYASLFTDRAISYREEQGFDHLEVALSVGVQEMVRADEGGSGGMFTLDTDTGFPRVVLIDAAWGLGENVIGGEVNPDEYTVFKPLLDTEGLCPIIGKELGEKEMTMVATADGSGTENVETGRDHHHLGQLGQRARHDQARRRRRGAAALGRRLRRRR